MTPRCISPVCHLEIKFQGYSDVVDEKLINCLQPSPVISSPWNLRWRPKTGSSFILACVVVSERYFESIIIFFWSKKMNATIVIQTRIYNGVTFPDDRGESQQPHWIYHCLHAKLLLVCAFVVASWKMDLQLILTVFMQFLCVPHPLKHTITVLHCWDVSNTCHIYFRCDSDT